MSWLMPPIHDHFTHYYTHAYNMDSQAIAIALDRLKFYAKDAAFTLSQVSPKIISLSSTNLAVRVQTVSLTTDLLNGH
jgi:hypothetical protein